MKKRIYVGNIPFTATEADVRAFLAPLAVSAVTVARDRETGRARGFAHAEVEVRDLAATCAEYDGRDFGGRCALVSEAVDRLPRANDLRPKQGLRRDRRPNSPRRRGEPPRGWRGDTEE